MTKTKKVPDYLCADCAEGFEKQFEVSEYGCTMHIGKCPICKEEKWLASAADYGLKKEYEFD